MWAWRLGDTACVLWVGNLIWGSIIQVHADLEALGWRLGEWRKGGQYGEREEACALGTQLQRSSCLQPEAQTCGKSRSFGLPGPYLPTGPATCRFAWVPRQASPPDSWRAPPGHVPAQSPERSGARVDAWGRARGGERGGAERREREGGARTLIGHRHVPRPFMAAGLGYGSKTKGRRPARRRQEDASRPEWAPTAGARPGSHRDRLKTELAPTEPGPDGRSGPRSGREYGRASGVLCGDLRISGSGRRGSTCWARAGRAGVRRMR
jgi:hypothetical protein